MGSPRNMKAVGLFEFGGPEVLQIVELPIPEAGPGELRIRVQAAAVNPTDASFRMGRRAAELETSGRPAPWVPGMDVSGIVDQLGTQSDGRLELGAHVVAYVLPFDRRGGAYAEWVVIDQRSVVTAPAWARPIIGLIFSGLNSTSSAEVTPQVAEISTRVLTGSCCDVRTDLGPGRQFELLWAGGILIHEASGPWPT